MRKVLLMLLIMVAVLTGVAAPAGAIVHGVTPVECANSANAGGVQAAGPNPNFDPAAPAPVPITSSGGQTQGQGDVAPTQC
jgi:hypothetical protein